jgi:hypothetical protein
VRSSRERYIRPPLVALEPRSDRAAIWRFRIVFGLVLVALAVGVFLLYLVLTGGSGEGSPGINQGAAGIWSALDR